MIGLLYRPIVTEKMTNMQEKGLYAFEVAPGATKIDIARAVEKKFNVSVRNVRTMNCKGKTKSQMTKRGKFQGTTSRYKKAIVTLKEGDKINLFENV